MARDLYSVLGVSKDADEETIKKAYRKLAQKHHPDRAPGKANEAQFKEINRAYEVLSDKQKRSLYDEFGEESLSQNFDAERARVIRQYGGAGRRGAPGGFGGQPGVDIGEIWGGPADGGFLWGYPSPGGRGGGGGGGARPARGPDLESAITIDFNAAVKGTTLSLQPRGGGGEPVTVRVPPGATEGSRLRIPGQGGEGRAGGPRGDLLLEIHVTPHPFFKREGDDLHLDVPVTIGEAFRGEKIRVPTPDGEVTLKVPKHAQSGQVMRLPGKGVARKGKEPGDLYVRFLVHIPRSDEPEVEKAVEALDKHVADPRKGLVF